MSESLTHAEPREEEQDFSRENLKNLLFAVNDASAAARTAWLFFLALTAYFFVAVAGVTDRDLLLNSPVQLPVMNIQIRLEQFFLFAPLVYLLVHFGLMIQHVLLHRKVCKLDSEMSRLERRVLSYPLRLRYQVHSYFYTQKHAGPWKRGVFTFFLMAMYHISFVILPVLLLLYFQISFLSYHDIDITGLHRAYLIGTALLLLVMRSIQIGFEATTLRQTFRNALAYFLTFSFGVVLSIVAILASFGVATIPDSKYDCLMRLVSGQLSSRSADRSGLQSLKDYFIGTPEEDTERRSALQRCRNGEAGRSAFFLTGWLFDGEVDLSTGRSKSWFSRNLIVTDQDLVSKPASSRFSIDLRTNGAPAGSRPAKPPLATAAEDKISISLRGRNLRYATLDRSQLRRADFRNADLLGASLRGTNLRAAHLSCISKPHTNTIGQKYGLCTKLTFATLERADLRGADLQGASLNNAKIRWANMERAILISSDLRNADLSFANLKQALLIRARLQNAKLVDADLDRAQLRFAQMQGADLTKARMRRANLTLANLTNAILEEADLQEASLAITQAQGARFREAKMMNADISVASLHGADLSAAFLQGANLSKAILQGAVMTSANLQCTNLAGTRLQGADLRLADLRGANMAKASINAADLRQANLWGSVPPQQTHFADLRETKLEDPNAGLRQVFTVRATALQKRVADKFENTANTDYDCTGLLAFLGDETTSWSMSQAYTDWQRLGMARELQVGSDTSAPGLSAYLTKIVCNAKSSARFVAQGLVKRVIRSLEGKRMTFQEDPQLLLENFNNPKRLVKKSFSAEDAQSLNGCDIVGRLDPSLLWQLSLAAEVHNQRRAKK